MRTDAEPLLVVSSLNVAYGDVVAVEDATFIAAAGERIAIVGESGSGKSTLGLAISGLVDRRGGRVGPSSVITVAGRNMLASPARNAKRGSVVGMVFQDPLAALNPVRTIGSQFSEVLIRHEKAATRGEARLMGVKALGDVGIGEPERRLQAHPHELSGGMRQRVLMAMTLSLEPQVIVADEPTSALDGESKAQVLDLLETAATERGAAVLLITHDMLAAGGFSSHTLVMYDGRVVESGTTDDVYVRPLHPYTSNLITAIPTMATNFGQRLPTVGGESHTTDASTDACNFRARCAYAEDRCANARPPDVAREGHSAHCHFAGDLNLAGARKSVARAAAVAWLPAVRGGGEPLIELDGVSMMYRLPGGMRTGRRSLRALDDVSFSVSPNESVGVVGESGSGKSTLGRLCAYLQPPTHGRVVIAGQDVWNLRRSERRALRRRIQIVFQDPRSALDPRIRVRDAIAEPLHIHSIGSSAERAAAVGRAMDLVALPPSLADRLPLELSGGQVQRVALARALVLDPDVLILDEPTSSLDASMKSGVLNLLNDLRMELQLTYVLITHDLPTVRNLCERTVVLNGGQMVEEGRTEQVLRSPSIDYTIRLLSHESVSVPEAERERRRAAHRGSDQQAAEREATRA